MFGNHGCQPIVRLLAADGALKFDFGALLAIFFGRFWFRVILNHWLPSSYI